MGVLSRPEDLSAPARSALIPAILLILLGLWACETPLEPTPPAVSSSDRPTATRRGGGGGGGGGHEAAGNNLSFPVVWSDGVELALRGIEGVERFQGPYFLAGGKPWYVQDDPGNEWQADNLNAVTEGAGTVTVDVVDWGDNLEAKSWPHGSQVRVETVLYEGLSPPMTAYEMQARDPSVSGPSEVWGTSGGTYPSDVATVYSGMARLVIQRLTRERDAPDLSLTWDPAQARWTGDAAEPVFSGGVWTAVEGPGGYSAEINVQGKVIYGYNWVTDVTGDGPGDYRITFVLDEANSSLASPNTRFGGATTIAPREEEEAAVQAEGGEPDLGGGTAAVTPEHDLTYIDVRLTEGESGQGGQGSGGGSGGPPDRGGDDGSGDGSPGDDGSDGDPGNGDGSPDDEGDAPDDGDESPDDDGEAPSDRGSPGDDGERGGDRAGPGEDENSTSGIGNRRARGDLTALWVGCPDAEKKGGGHGGPGESGGCGGEHDEEGGPDDHGDHEDEPCSGGHDEGVDPDDHQDHEDHAGETDTCPGDHEDDEGGCADEHEDGDSCSGDHDESEHAGGGHPGGKHRPTTHFHLRFDVREQPAVGGEAEVAGVGDDADVRFGGQVRWIVEGRRSHELFFGGELTEAVVGRSCFLFSVQDNGGARSGPQEPDRLQYRLYGKDTEACSAPPPDHLPKGYPIALQEGFLRVAEPPAPPPAGSPSPPGRR